jgi:hypothetical protein
VTAVATWNTTNTLVATPVADEWGAGRLFE